MDLKISDLPPQFENIATKIGIDITKVLFGGESYLCGFTTLSKNK